MEEYPHQFTLGDVSFRGGFLPPDTSLDVFAVMAPAIGRVLDKMDWSASDKEAMLASLFSSALSSVKEAKSVAPHFVGRYQVHIDGKWVPLGTFKEDVFLGKPALMLSWLIAAIKSEYRDFLHSNGWSTLQDLAKVCGFQVTLKGTGQSGESSTESTQP